MFITAREASGLRGQRWSAGWDTPASQLLTSSSVCLMTIMIVSFSNHDLYKYALFWGISFVFLFVSSLKKC